MPEERILYQDAHWRLRLVPDDSPVDPREDADQLWTWVCWHRRYALGDPHAYRDPADFAQRGPREALREPLYLLDQGDLTISRHNCQDPWDCKQIGWAVLPLDRLQREYGSTNEVAQIKALSVLDGEIQDYNAYLRGDVWGYVLERNHNGAWEQVDSAWGFYRDDWRTNGMAESWPEALVDKLEQMP